MSYCNLNGEGREESISHSYWTRDFMSRLYQLRPSRSSSCFGMEDPSPLDSSPFITYAGIFVVKNLYWNWIALAGEFQSINSLTNKIWIDHILLHFSSFSTSNTNPPLIYQPSFGASVFSGFWITDFAFHTSQLLFLTLKKKSQLFLKKSHNKTDKLQSPYRLQ